MSIRRVQVSWTGITTAAGGLSTFYFDDAVGSAQQAATAVGAFLDATEDQRTTGLSWTLLPDVATLNEETGALQVINTVTADSGVGTATGDVLPPQTQGLLRLISNTIANGRLIRGRLFLPGVTEAKNTASGVPDTIYRGDYDTAAAALIADANTAWQVWSRFNGTAVDIVSASTWTKWASLRSRRD